MMRGFGISIVVLVFSYAVSSCAGNVTVACMMAYDEGGTRAVLQSSECFQWIPSTEVSKDNRENCEFSMLQGRRKYQEDRVTCNLDMKIAYLGNDGRAEATIGIAAVFDGHGGKEASELVSEKFIDYFRLNVQFKAYKRAFPLYLENEEAVDSKLAHERSFPTVDDKLLHDILEEALTRTFQDIDSEFFMEAQDNGYVGGSTGTVGLLLNGRILIGYVGDSKALLCRKTIQSHQGATEFHAEELTEDHHPDRDGEKARILAAGGFVSTRGRGVPRVNGILAVSRAIGDVDLKRYGVIAVPEVIGWRNLTGNDTYLVIASDGIFERLSPQEVCIIMQSTQVQEKQASSLLSCSSSSSLAECIVNNAFHRGSTDNLSAVIVPLRLSPSPSSSQQDAEATDRTEL